MTWKSKCSYWTLLRPKYCAPPLTGSARMSAPNDAASATRREAIRIIVQSRGRTATEDLHGDATATPHAAKKGKDGAPYKPVAALLPVVLRTGHRSDVRAPRARYMYPTGPIVASQAVAAAIRWGQYRDTMRTPPPVLPDEADQPRYKTTWLDRHGTEGGLKLRAIGYGLVVFGSTVVAALLLLAQGDARVGWV